MSLGHSPSVVRSTRVSVQRQTLGHDQLASLDATCETEVAGHHRHGGGGELQDDGAQRPDGERSGRACDAGHGATSYRSMTPGVNDADG